MFTFNSNLTHKVFQKPIYFLAFGFGSGLSPILPGTFGTLAAIPLYLLIKDLPWLLYLLITIIAFVYGIYICNMVSKDLGEHDYPGIVWDEIVGYFITMFLAPKTASWMLLGFLLFRIFDIWKPQPIRYFDKHVQGGIGIMLDDVIAALFAWIILQCIVVIVR